MPEKAKPRAIAKVRTPDRAPWHASKYVRLGALGIVAVAAAVTIALVLSNGSTSSPETTQTTVTPVWPIALSASGLKKRARDLNQVIYWVGPVAGDKYELTRTTANEVYVRYLPQGKTLPATGKELVVATYPFAGALDALTATDGRHLEVAGGKGGIAVIERGKPTNVRVAFPGVDYQIEVYDPSAKKARTLATSAALAPVP